MALTASQKRKVTQLATMLKNTRTLSADMSDSNLGYAKDLEKAFLGLQQLLQTPKEGLVKFNESDIKELTTKSNRDFLTGSKVGQRPKPPRWRRNRGNGGKSGQSESSQQSETPEPAQNTKPEKWAKALYRSIISKSHPDKVDNRDDWSLLKKEKYKQIAATSMTAYKEANHAELLICGSEIGIFSRQLPMSDQMSILNTEYMVHVKKIDVIQESLSWKWGSYWTTREEKIKILQLLCINNGFQPPRVEDIIEAIENTENT